MCLKGGKFAPLTIMNNEDADMDSVITTLNTAVTETASEILKHCQKKMPWVIEEILDQCNKRGELREKKFKSEGSEKHKESEQQHQEVYEKGKRKLDRGTV